MAARRYEPGDDRELVPFNFRIPKGLVSELDDWLVSLNEGRSGPLLNRSDLIRGVLSWAARHRPEWEESRHMAELQDDSGKVLSRRAIRQAVGLMMDFVDQSTGQTTRGLLKETRVDGDKITMVFRVDPGQAASKVGKR